MANLKSVGSQQGSRSRWRGARLLGGIATALLALIGGFLATVMFSGSAGSVLSGIVGAFAVFGAYWAYTMLWRTWRGEEAAGDLLGPAALAASGDAMAVVEDGDKVAEANAAYRALSRTASGDAPTPERFLSRVPGTQAAMGELLGAVAEGRTYSRVIGFDTDGRGRQLQISVQPLGRPRRVLWALRVIDETPLAPPPPPPPPPATEQDAVAHALLAAWEQAPAGIARLSNGRVVQPSAGFCRFLGYGLAEWSEDGLALEEVVAPEDIPQVRKELAPGRGPSSQVVSLTRKNGAAAPVLMRIGVADGAGSATVVVLPHAPQAGGEPAAAVPAGAEVDRFFLRAPLASALVDPQGGIRAANAAFERLFAYDGGSRPLSELVAERDAGAVDGFLAAARATGAQPCDVAVHGAGGRTARLYAAPLEDRSGQGDIALCAIDTTDQRALEAQFAQSQRLQAVGHLAGGVAHDFNNVLTAIIGYCDLLLARHRPSDPSFPDIMQIKQNANRAAALVRQLLAFSRRQTLRPQVIELTDVISDVSELLRRLIGERITLEVRHARDLWPVKVDVNQFEQVIVNLVVNARDAMPDGGTLTLRTLNVPQGMCAAYGQALVPGDYVLVEVEDTGSGIPPEVMDKIFEPFFSTKEVGKGTGLGLSTVYGIVQQTGGTILAASEPGRGSVFRVFLPRHVAGPEDEAPRPAEPEVKVGDSTGRGRVLLVEDEDAVRAFAGRALSARGYEVIPAASGAEALEIMDQLGQKLDLVISDVVMPEMDGPSLLRELRARDPSLKVIFISGYAEEAFARNLPPSEPFSFLPKPFSLKELVAAVNAALRGGD